jgi:hypothetical protein
MLLAGQSWAGGARFKVCKPERTQDSGARFRCKIQVQDSGGKRFFAPAFCCVLQLWGDLAVGFVVDWGDLGAGAIASQMLPAEMIKYLLSYMFKYMLK